MASQGNGQPQSQFKRPPVGASTSSEQKQNGCTHTQPALAASPSNTQKPHHKVHTRQHVVGHARMGARVPSHGKNLNKHAGETTPAGKHHRRSHSHTPSSSPRGGQYRRTGSNPLLARNGSKTHVPLRANGSAADVGSYAGAAVLPQPSAMQRSLSQPVRSERITRGAVKFDLGGGGQDASWTSTSESPSNTRSTAYAQNQDRQDRGRGASKTEPRDLVTDANGALVSASPTSSTFREAATTSGHSAAGHRSSRSCPRKHLSTTPPQAAEIITSRLLQRHPPQNAPPQMSTLSATATPGNRSPSSSSHEQPFTNGTPGTQENVVSRFIGGSSDTHAICSVSPGKSILDASNIGTENGAADTKAETQRTMEAKSSGGRSAKPSLSSYNHPPSRTQQKLWLQRASSGIEPQQLAPSAGVGGMPGVRASSGGIGALGGGYSDTRDPRLQREFERTGLEYLVVRRYKNPVGDSLARLAELPGAQKNRRIPAQQLSRSYTNGGGDGPMGLSQSLREGRARDHAGSSGSVGTSFDGNRGSKDDNGIARPDSSRGLVRHSDEIDQVLRRMWDRVEMT
ncbi:hypothetical protein GP486_005922, partial [Trichoglossum hirsutum]